VDHSSHYPLQNSQKLSGMGNECAACGERLAQDGHSLNMGSRSLEGRLSHRQEDGLSDVQTQKGRPAEGQNNDRDEEDPMPRPDELPSDHNPAKKQRINGRKMASVVQSTKYQDGSTFQGEIVEGKREGYGIQIWQDGSRYKVIPPLI
jgi:hypothetical protein